MQYIIYTTETEVIQLMIFGTKCLNLRTIEMSYTNFTKMYCVKCRHKTDTLDIKNATSRNNRAMITGRCAVCNIKKTLFVKKGGFVNTILNSGWLPELHLPGHSYTGPGTKLKDRLLRDDKPVNKLDSAAREHDMAYAIFKDKKDRHVFDKKLQDEAAKIMKDPSSTIKEKLEAGLVSGVMAGKRKLGLGH
jgi:hypothetical protein